MKKILIFVVFALITHIGYAQPSFALVGYGAGTTGGQGGTVVPVSDYATLAANVVGTDSKILNITGTITGPAGGVILDVGSNKSFIGLGCNATISQIQLHLKNSNNIIIQNIKFTMIGSTLGSDADMICMETTSTNECSKVWIDHCEFYNIKPTLPETAAKKDLYDGMIDIKKSYSNITISWNYFHDHWKCNLIGFTDTDVYDRKITFHHNYWKDIKSREPSYRGGTGHIYNNYYDGLLIEDESAPGVWVGTLVSTGVHTRENACLKVENNYFRNYDKTIYNDIADCTFEGFAHGSGNIFVNSLAQTAATCASFATGYAYTMDAATDVPAIVSMWSGVGKIGGTAPVLSDPANKDQTPAGAITSIVFTWGGTATNVTATGLPAGLTGVANAGAKTYTITGTPSASGTYTITTTGGSCGTVSRQGTITVSNNASLTDPANKTQSVVSGTPIASIVFTWGGGATDVTVAGLPAGITSVKNAGAKTLTISGSPTATGTYTVSTVGGTGAPVVITGTITATLNPPTLTDPANKSQTIIQGASIANIVFTWGGGATDVTVAGLPAGLTATKNAGAKTVSISGTPSAIATTTYSVTTVGGTGAAVVLSGTIAVQAAITCLNLVTIPIASLATTGTYSMVLFDAAGTTQIKVLADGIFTAGDSDFLFSKAALASGTYTWKLMNGATIVKTGGVIIP